MPDIPAEALPVAVALLVLWLACCWALLERH
jgi:hypothetical protein